VEQLRGCYDINSCCRCVRLIAMLSSLRQDKLEGGVQ
jgi:hypothetical protein